ncbi:MAG TPA: plasmid stabilization system [Prolixibacteraceae bacterium]|nr:MAG: plasmid stabilization system [Bacteroidetes bacterium GWB2_41_8]HCY43787.1 plasmid stabilization system [Prolixibacteraceae bacterium]
MANKKIIWSAHSGEQLKAVLNFYTKRNGSINYSLKILNEIEDLLKALSENEFIGRLTSNKTTRVIPMRVYLIFYEIHKNQIEIVSFWDNRQNKNKPFSV